jgi:sn-glycerol 3-phosphate transport system substrate-binding protein
MATRKHLLLIVCLLTIALLGIVPALAQDKPAEVAAWIAWTGDRLDWWNQKAEIFNAKFPQYHVTVQGNLTYEGLDKTIKLAAEQGTLPAIVHYNEVSTLIARDSGNFKSIADALGDRTEVNGVPTNFDDFIQPVKAYYTLDGKFTSMPFNTSSALLFSNMTMLKAAGVDAPPATWADVEAACAKIMAMSNKPEQCLSFVNHGWFFEQWLAQQNALIANNDNGRSGRATEVVFNSEAGVAIANWLKKMYGDGYLYYSGKRDGDAWQPADDAFLATKAAMLLESSSDTAFYTDTGKKNGFDVAASRLPYNQDAPGGWTGNIIGGGSMWLVNGLTKEQEDGALTFLLWLTNTDNMAEWHQITGYFPIRQSSIDLLTTDKWWDEISPGAAKVWTDNATIQGSKGKNWFETNPNFIVAPKQISDSKVTPATQGGVMGAFPDIRSVVTGATDKILLTKDADPKAVLDQAVTDGNKILSDYNAVNAP